MAAALGRGACRFASCGIITPHGRIYGVAATSPKKRKGHILGDYMSWMGSRDNLGREGRSFVFRAQVLIKGNLVFLVTSCRSWIFLLPKFVQDFTRRYPQNRPVFASWCSDLFRLLQEFLSSRIGTYRAQANDGKLFDQGDGVENPSWIFVWDSMLIQSGSKWLYFLWGGFRCHLLV